MGSINVKTAAEVEVENLAAAKTAVENAIDNHVESTAKAKGYNSAESCISYIGGPNLAWNAEGVAFQDWRIQVWEYVIAELAKVDAGTRTVPTPEDAVAELPAMVWPV